MECVFITIHDLSLDARIKFCSDSVEDILGYLPSEVKGKSCWEYFHPDEIPFARAIHGRGIDLDKAAALNYCRIKHKDGSWVGCECVFSIVGDALVASTSIYKRGPKARRRALDGAHVRRIFSSSPKDPRYHMLSYISNKFYQEPAPHSRESRAALFLNRFTRTSTIMFATAGVADILGIRADQLVGKSFYYCIAENCLQDAVKCLESAKGNDSIAYLRFWFRNPLQEPSTRDASMVDGESNDEDEDDGGVRINREGRTSSSVEMADPSPSIEPNAAPAVNGSQNSHRTNGHDAPQVNGHSAESHMNHTAALTNGYHTNHAPQRPPISQQVSQAISEVATVPDAESTHAQLQDYEAHVNNRTSSDQSTDLGSNSRDAIFDPPGLYSHSSTSTRDPPGLYSGSSSSTPQDEIASGIELEAVVSCTSDGLVVVLRRAHPLVPHVSGTTEVPHFENGMFASPWALDPIMPRTTTSQTVDHMSFPTTPQPQEASFLSAIRDVAVFAWSLTGINGSIAQYSKGDPSGESLPPGGLPIWDPHAGPGVGDMYNGFAGSLYRPVDGMGEPSPLKNDESSSSSEDEVVWKRDSVMPAYRRPKRRAHDDAFGEDGSPPEPRDADGRDSQSRRRKTDGEYKSFQ